MVPLGHTGVRLVITAVCVLFSTMALAPLSGCSEPGLRRGLPSADEAAQAFVKGVVEDDAALVSEAMGYEVSAAEVARWRSEVLGVDSVLADAEPKLVEAARNTGSGDSESSPGATFLLDSIDAAAMHLSADDGSMREVGLVVMKDRGWHVVLVEPMEVVE